MFMGLSGKKVSVKVKDVGNYKIHVKESIDRGDLRWQFAISMIPTIISAILLISNLSEDGLHFKSSMQTTIGIIAGISSFGVLYFCLLNPFKWFEYPAYYIDTTMYGVGGKTIRKTTPEQDHIAICRAAQEFEKEILERINKEKELEEIVGKCK